MGDHHGSGAPSAAPVGVADALKADDIFDRLMGSDVEPRKRFIQTHATSVRNLDV